MLPQGKSLFLMCRYGYGGGSGKSRWPLDRLYTASTVQVAIPAYVIRSHFTASSASANTHARSSPQTSSSLPLLPSMQLCKLSWQWWNRSLTRVFVACSGGGEPTVAQRGAGAPLSRRIAGGEEAGHRSCHLSSSFQLDWRRCRLLISGSCMSLGNGSGRAGGHYLSNQQRKNDGSRWW